MAGRKDDQAQLEMGAAVLATCIVQTLNEADSTFQARFLERLERAYYELRDKPTTSIRALEDLAWCRELLTGYSPTDWRDTDSADPITVLAYDEAARSELSAVQVRITSQYIVDGVVRARNVHQDLLNFVLQFGIVPYDGKYALPLRGGS